MEGQSAATTLGTQGIGRLMVRFAVPSIVAQVVNSLYNMVDQIFIGQGVGYLGNAATNVILPMMVLLIALGQMIGDGCAAWISLKLGRGEAEDAARGVGSAITLTIVVGLVLMVLGVIFLEPLCRLFGATDAVLPYAMGYGRIIAWGYPLSAICCAFSSILRADGRPHITMLGLLMGCGTNFVLDPLFIFVFHWGVEGAAWATVLGQAINAVYFLLCLPRFRSIVLRRAHLLPRPRIAGRMLLLGMPSFITQISAVFVIYVVNNALVSYGALSKYGPDIPLAALGVTMKVNQLVNSMVLGLAVGMQPIVGYNYGNGQYPRAKKAFFLALLISTLIMAAAFLLFQFWPESVVSLFGEESGLYQEFAVQCLRIYLLLCWSVGVSTVIGIFFQSIGKPLQASVLTLSRQLIFRVPGVILLSRAIGVEGSLWSGPVADGLALILSLVLILLCWRRLFSPAEERTSSDPAQPPCAE